jgi:8-oxo-dGTP diphosphatase
MQPQTILEVGVKAFIINKAGKYLLLLRYKPYPGRTKPMWDIPGGRIHPGEPTQEALAREIKEETGLELGKVVRVLAAQDIQRVAGRHTVRITYLVTCKDSKTIALDPEEHSDYRWLTLSELTKTYHDLFLDPVIEELSKG